MSQESIPILGGFLTIVFGGIADLYNLDHVNPLPLDAPLPSEYLKRYHAANALGELEVLYLGINYLLKYEGEGIVRFNMSEQEWSHEEFRHLLLEIKAAWFPKDQPTLDALVSKVQIVGGLPISTWCETELPKLRERLPKFED